MADENNKTDNQDSKDKGKTRRGIMLPLVLLAVVLVCAGSGFMLGKILAKSPSPEAEETSQAGQSASTGDMGTDTSGTEAKSWCYDLDPVVANLDEPGVTRYVRTTLTLEIGPGLDEKTGAAFFEQKKPFITNWLTIYLASLTLDDIRGDQNLKRIQAQVLDILNENLFPDAKPQVVHILFKEFAVQ